MNGHRTCIICLPRSGSQWCEKLVREIHNAHALGEYFESWHTSTYTFNNNNYVINKQSIFNDDSYNLTVTITEHIDLLKKINPTQPLIIRFFLFDHYDKNDVVNIMKELKILGFEFILLKRNLKEQLLSYIIARTYKLMGDSYAFFINSDRNRLITVDIDDQLLRGLNKIYNSSINWEKNIQEVFIKIKYQKVKYETLQSDMEKIYNRNFNYTGSKSIKTNPEDLILNKNEVLDLLANEFKC